MTILFDVGIDDDNQLNTKLKRPKVFAKYVFVYVFRDNMCKTCSRMGFHLLN